MKRAMCQGVWDLCHIGHLNLIKRAAALVDQLVVGVVEDEAVRRQKGPDRPMTSFEHRFAIIEELKSTYLAVASKEFDPYDAFIEAVNKLGPIEMFIKGEDQGHIDTSRIEAMGVKIHVLSRTPDVSSTDLIKRIRSSDKNAE